MIVGRAIVRTKEQCKRCECVGLWFTCKKKLMETSGRRWFSVSRTRRETHVATVRSNKAHSCICNKTIFLLNIGDEQTQSHTIYCNSSSMLCIGGLIATQSSLNAPLTCCSTANDNFASFFSLSHFIRSLRTFTSVSVLFNFEKCPCVRDVVRPRIESQRLIARRYESAAPTCFLFYFEDFAQSQ